MTIALHKKLQYIDLSSIQFQFVIGKSPASSSCDRTQPLFCSYVPYRKMRGAAQPPKEELAAGNADIPLGSLRALLFRRRMDELKKG
jgi:hypothetical protein